MFFMKGELKYSSRLHHVTVEKKKTDPCPLSPVLIPFDLVLTGKISSGKRFGSQRSVVLTLDHNYLTV